jgi:hypothetical protein
MTIATLKQRNDTLEAIIDQYGLQNTLDAIGTIAREKAEHARTNWQDSHLARQWDKAANTLDTTAARASVHIVSVDTYRTLG